MNPIASIAPSLFATGTTVELELGVAERLELTIAESFPDRLVLTATGPRPALGVLTPGTPACLWSVRRGARFAYPTTILDHAIAPTTRITVCCPVASEGRQRRASVRVPVAVSHATLQRLDVPDGSPASVMLLCLSAGGGLLTTRVPLPHRTPVLVTFDVPDTVAPVDPVARPRARLARQSEPRHPGPTTGTRKSGRYALHGQVVRCAAPESASGRAYRLGIQWDALPPAEEARLVRIVFRRERELRQQGIL